MKNSARILLGLGLGALSAALLVFAFQPYSIWPLAFIALIPMLIAEHRVLPLRWAGLAPGVAIGVWLAIFMTSLFGVNQVTWIFLAVAGLVALGGILSAPALRRFHDRTGYRWFLLHGAADAAGIEMIRSFIPPIHTHAFWAQTMYAQPWMLQGISVFSIYGLTVVVMLVNFALALGCILVIGRKWQLDERPEMNRKSVFQWMVVAGAVFALWAAFGLVTLAGIPEDAPTIRVAAIQHGFAKPGHQDPDTQEERLAVLSEQTRLAADQGARFVVWPELGLGFDPQVEHTAELQALAAETNAYILIGYGLVTPNDQWRNEAVMLAPSGEFMAVYGKNFPSSPGEPRIISSGTYPVYETELGNLGTIICNDVNFTVTTRTLAKNGARLIAIPTFEPFAPGLGWEQRTQTVLRAVENHISIIKAESAGISMIVDPFGRIVAQANLPEGVANALVADVPLGTGDTLYTKFLGDWMGWIGLAGFIVFSMLINRKKTLKSDKAIHAPLPA